jgi:adenylate cyclase
VKLLKDLPDEPQRAGQELEFLLPLAESLRWTEGYGSAEAGPVLERAREICTLMGKSTELFSVLQNLQGHHQIRLDLDTARDLGEQLLTLAQGAGEPAKVMVAHASLGLVFLTTGELKAARDHFERARPRFDWGQTNFLAFYPCFGAWALWLLGYPDQALEWNRESLALALALSRPAPLANALSLATLVHMFVRDPRAAQESAEAAIAIATEHGLPFEVALGTFARGWALAQQGRLNEGIAEMRWAVARFAASGYATRSRWFVLLAEAYAKSEGPGVALKVLADGRALMERSGEQMFEAELYRVNGELLLMQQLEDLLEAENCFRTAIEVARRQGAKSLELRATSSLARLLARQCRRDEARAMLSDVYNWFTEGFDTADLNEAKALLDELSR